jgi:hypothetical protein
MKGRSHKAKNSTVKTKTNPQKEKDSIMENSISPNIEDSPVPSQQFLPPPSEEMIDSIFNSQIASIEASQPQQKQPESSMKQAKNFISTVPTKNFQQAAGMKVSQVGEVIEGDESLSKVEQGSSVQLSAAAKRALVDKLWEVSEEEEKPVKEMTLEEVGTYYAACNNWVDTSRFIDYSIDRITRPGK